MTTEAELKDKLRKIESLFAGATTAGEGEAAQAARERIQAKLHDQESREQPGGDAIHPWRWLEPEALPGALPPLRSKTLPEARPDGDKIDYLAYPDRWRRSDPELFDFLSGTVTKGSQRNLTTFENANLIPQAVYHSDLLGDSHAERTNYMDSMMSRFNDLDLVFFDPDNGLEVRSCPMGRKGFSKYLAVNEATKVFGAGKSLLIFQHFGRVRREVYIPAQMERLGLATGAAKIIALATSNVLFLFALQWDHTAAVEHSLRILSERWPGQFRKASMTATS